MATCKDCGEGEVLPKGNGRLTGDESAVFKGQCKNCGQTYSMDFYYGEMQRENY